MREIDNNLLKIVTDECRIIPRLIDEQLSRSQLEQIVKNVIEGKIKYYLVQAISKQTCDELDKLVSNIFKKTIEDDGFTLLIRSHVKKYLYSADFEHEIEQCIYNEDHLEVIFREIANALKSIKKDAQND
jgi:galactitol-specific phosphotransferase system IIB component